MQAVRKVREFSQAGAGLVAALVLLAGCLSGCQAIGEAERPQSPSQAAGFAPGTEEAFMLDVGRRIYFAEGSAELDAESRQIVLRQAQWLNTNTRWLAKIQGHAQEPGGEAANKRLSERRAQAVYDLLVAQGVDPRRIWTKGYGIERPETDCDPADCPRMNRRVVVNLREEYDDTAPQR
ncbi:OmpA family protein [Microvirga tunisiensis]|uniref:OmpA family protein n=1 Tax=Pannonibacter tanglangensis TaxID=2750084 RepID=A0A7X5F525_9HYPH|nr:OmpA family protein [Pannonibacter sp. XCT-53]NBN79669.1 OmpA family protein [Pannonibacter sp. XCT-53]